MIAVIDYGLGNLRSAVKALDAAGAPALLTDDPRTLGQADGVVLPGVGSFGRSAEALDRGNWRRAIKDVVAAGTPFLGICVGYQLLFESSEESPDATGLGLIPGRIERISGAVKLPQIQWNKVVRNQGSSLFPTVDDEIWMYFVHSFALVSSPYVVATCEYGRTVPAAVEHENVFGVQFHPEKSGADGLAMLKRFGDLCASAA